MSKNIRKSLKNDFGWTDELSDILSDLESRSTRLNAKTRMKNEKIVNKGRTGKRNMPSEGVIRDMWFEKETEFHSLADEMCPTKYTS